MISLTNNSSATTQKLQAFLSGAAATTNPTCTVVSYIVPPQSKPDYSEYRRGTQFTVLSGATETDIADAPPSGSVKDIIYIAIYNADTASVTVTVVIDDNATNRIQCNAVLGVGSTLYYENERGWYVIDANGAEVTGSAVISAAWTPTLTFATPGDLNVVYSTRTGLYSKVGDLVWVNFTVITSTFTHTTAAGNLQVTGLPFTSVNSGSDTMGALQFSGITKATYTQIACDLTANSSIVLFVASGTAVSTAQVTSADLPTGGSVVLRGQLTYRAS